MTPNRGKAGGKERAKPVRAWAWKVDGHIHLSTVGFDLGWLNSYAKECGGKVVQVEVRELRPPRPAYEVRARVQRPNGRNGLVS